MSFPETQTQLDRHGLPHAVPRATQVSLRHCRREEAEAQSGRKRSVSLQPGERERRRGRGRSVNVQRGSELRAEGDVGARGPHPVPAQNLSVARGCRAGGPKRPRGQQEEQSGDAGQLRLVHHALRAPQEPEEANPVPKPARSGTAEREGDPRDMSRSQPASARLCETSARGKALRFRDLMNKQRVGSFRLLPSPGLQPLPHQEGKSLTA